MSGAGLLSEGELRERVTRLAALDRPSASTGELVAAELIAAELREVGARVTIEPETVHGTHWWPTGLPVAVATAAGLVAGGPPSAPRRLIGAALAALGLAAVVDDLGGGSHWLRRRVLSQRQTTNVVAELGDPDSERTVLITAHHDAARSGLIFHPDLPRAFLRRFPAVLEHANTSPPVMWGAVAGPALVALGALTGARRARRSGTAVSAAYTTAFVDIGLRAVVPGANDNLTGVAALLSLAHALGADGPPAGLRVILLSTGAEESHQEGMRAYAARHFPELAPERTHVICLDTLGSPRLAVLEGEGMLKMTDYPAATRDLVERCGAEVGVDVLRGLRFRNATDGLIALRAGYPCAALVSVDEFKVPTHYHWPTDTADRVDYARVADAARLCLALVRRLAPGGA